MKAIEPAPEYEKFCFPTPGTFENPSFLTSDQRHIYDQITYLKSLELCDPKLNDHDRLTFLNQFNWENSILTNDRRLKVECLLVEYSYI